jgi:hypothetical protein
MVSYLINKNIVLSFYLRKKLGKKIAIKIAIFNEKLILTFLKRDIL